MPYPTKKLGEISKLIMGQSPESKTYNRKKNGLPFYQGKKEFGEFYPTPEVYCSEPIKIVEKGDILISVRAPVGPTNLCQEKSCIGRGLAGIRANLSIIELGYLRAYFKKFESEIVKLGKGSTFTSITKSDLETLSIPLPPLQNQQLIVKKLDDAFTNINAQIELLKNNISRVVELNKSVLEEVFSDSKFQRKTIESISENVQYGYTGKTIQKGNYRYLRITDIQNNNIIWDEVPFVDIKKEEVKKYSLNEGDIVFARTGATVGKSCLIDSRGVGNVFASYLIRIVPKIEFIFPNFLQYFFYSKNYWEQIGFDVVGAAQPNFNGTKLKQISLPLPPLEKQKEIVTYLDQVFEKNKALKEKYQAQIQTLQEMKQSLLADAFEGKLV